MATDMPADTAAADERWQRMWSHREQLLKVARRRSMSQEDAEDAVHEAMLRAAERPDLDDERLGAWLTTVTMRLCVDRYRQVNREAEVGSRPTLVSPGPVPVEEVVCDRAEAKWLAVRSGELPARQAEALRLKSQDLDVGQVAMRMGLSYRTVESLLARARRTLRASLAGTLALALFLVGRGRLRGGGKAQAVAVASTAATLAVAGFLLPYALDAGGHGKAPAPRPAVSGDARIVSGEATGPGPALGTRTPPAPAAGPGARKPSPSPETSLPVSVPSLPDASSLPDLPAPQVPRVPDVPAVPGLPTAVPDLPARPAAPSAPSLAPIPAAPAVPSAPLSAPAGVPTPRTPTSTPSPKLP
ncbi:sigma-70 family RNA polymerase sigma factor [Streptomyces sp. NBC_00557]|uniref:sigma-70 family RNA polymerase sigma factor n=1 Tax=Streptomyces sp. NBC_00557 TaxID=2975776 RepID=UPI002E822F2A|nr:sigma-70 family RNA polymerase sigma factor [Streptomyces sp. NBC_00557]WUC33704.1 sigma-70 family RNA polymerase sigma factor [Streptomyces sp. NBC_00557]